MQKSEVVIEEEKRHGRHFLSAADEQIAAVKTAQVPASVSKVAHRNVKKAQTVGKCNSSKDGEQHVRFIIDQIYMNQIKNGLLGASLPLLIHPDF